MFWKNVSHYGANSKEKIRENLEAEALDVILIETADAFVSEQIYEIDTTSTERESVVRSIISFANGETSASFWIA